MGVVMGCDGVGGDEILFLLNPAIRHHDLLTRK